MKFLVTTIAVIAFAVWLAKKVVGEKARYFWLAWYLGFAAINLAANLLEPTP